MSEALERQLEWVVLKGLPGDGPSPKYFHQGHPTPWREGLVLRFSHPDGRSWVGNFQPGHGRITKIAYWQQARAIVVVARGALYVFESDNPEHDTAHGRDSDITGILFDPQGTTLFVSDEPARIFAYGQDRRVRWFREGLGGYNIELSACTQEVLTAEVQDDLDDPWRTVCLAVGDGKLLSPGAAKPAQSRQAGSHGQGFF